MTSVLKTTMITSLYDDTKKLYISLVNYETPEALFLRFEKVFGDSINAGKCSVELKTYRHGTMSLAITGLFNWDGIPVTKLEIDYNEDGKIFQITAPYFSFYSFSGFEKIYPSIVDFPVNFKFFLGDNSAVSIYYANARRLLAHNKVVLYIQFGHPTPFKTSVEKRIAELENTSPDHPYFKGIPVYLKCDNSFLLSGLSCVDAEEEEMVEYYDDVDGSQATYRFPYPTYLGDKYGNLYAVDYIELIKEPSKNKRFKYKEVRIHILEDWVPEPDTLIEATYNKILFSRYHTIETDPKNPVIIIKRKK